MNKTVSRVTESTYEHDILSFPRHMSFIYIIHILVSNNEEKLGRIILLMKIAIIASNTIRHIMTTLQTSVTCKLELLYLKKNIRIYQKVMFVRVWNALWEAHVIQMTCPLANFVNSGQ